jgi:hypothetical protein
VAECATIKPGETVKSSVPYLLYEAFRHVGAKNVSRACSSVVGIGLLCGILAFGQTASPPPAPVDTNVFEEFLRFQNFLLSAIQEEKGVDTGSSDAMRSSAAALLKISTAGFDKINPVYVTLKAKLDGLDSEGVAYVSSTAGNGKQADVKVLAGFEARRQTLVQAAIASLQSRLSKGDWSGLYGYVTGDFSKNITRVPVK